MFNQTIRKINLSVVLFRLGGWTPFWKQIRRLIYYSDFYVALERDTSQPREPIPCQEDYSTMLATEDDFRQILKLVNQESRLSAIELIGRISTYEFGFHRCYIDKNRQTGAIYSFRWLILPQDDAFQNNHKLKSIQPVMRENEGLLENGYTFEKYRGKRISTASVDRLCVLAQQQGITKVRAYIKVENQSSFASLHRAGFKEFEEIKETKFFFFLKRNYKSI
jgi:RimJ/RimL family protein N-acetyltransferase